MDYLIGRRSAPLPVKDIPGINSLPLGNSRPKKSFLVILLVLIIFVEVPGGYPRKSLFPGNRALFAALAKAAIIVAS